MGGKRAALEGNTIRSLPRAQMWGHHRRDGVPSETAQTGSVVACKRGVEWEREVEAEGWQLRAQGDPAHVEVASGRQGWRAVDEGGERDNKGGLKMGRGVRRAIQWNGSKARLHCRRDCRGRVSASDRGYALRRDVSDGYGGGNGVRGWEGEGSTKGCRKWRDDVAFRSTTTQSSDPLLVCSAVVEIDAMVRAKETLQKRFAREARREEEKGQSTRAPEGGESKWFAQGTDGGKHYIGVVTVKERNKQTRREESSTLYTPFTAKPPAHWQRVVRETVGSNDTSLKGIGPVKLVFFLNSD
ncbi:hypothetical protein B0H14DRAFT_3134780 [Mycena olivaceomarginata]|nr:hypothetical protein B0H14DRAFT_3134780 [Mycena olivaceomarginata]